MGKILSRKIIKLFIAATAIALIFTWQIGKINNVFASGCGAPELPCIDLTANGAHNSISITRGETVTFRWIIKNATACFSRAESTHSSEGWDWTPLDLNQYPLNVYHTYRYAPSYTTNYTIGCTNTIGTNSDAVRVIVNEPSPPPPPPEPSPPPSSPPPSPPQAGAPIVQTLTAINISHNSATLRGTINPNNASSQYWFQYGQTTSLGSVTSVVSAGSGSSPVGVSASLSNLNPNTTYYFRLVGQNSYGTNYGVISSFSTTNLVQPTLVISPSTGLINGIGNTQQFIALYDPDGPSGSQSEQNVTNLANWTSSNINIANPTSSKGQFIGVAAGTVTIIATYQNISASATLQVIASQPPSGNAPLVQTYSATNVSQNYATLNGSVNPNGASTSYWFEYGQSSSLGWTTNTYSAGSGNSYFNVSASVSNLAQNTTYYFRLVAQNSYGTSYGSILSFSTGGSPPPPPSGNTPLVQTYSATNVSQNSATLNGTVNPNNSATWYWFEYGQNTSLGYLTGTLSAGSGNSYINASIPVSGLWSNTTYYFRIVAENNYGRAYGTILSFSTGSTYQPPSGNAPLVQTYSATNVSQNYATLNGSVNPNGASTSYWFEYGQSSSLGWTTNTYSAGSGNSYFNVSASVSNLAQNTTYYFRLVAQNSYGTSYGSILSFSTGGGTISPITPLVNTLTASAVSINSAVLRGSVNPQNTAATVWFEYGTNYYYLGLTTPTQYLGTANNEVSFSSPVSGLTPGTLYYFRAVAQNQFGIFRGSILNFLTLGQIVITTPPIVITQPKIITTVVEPEINCVSLTPNLNPSQLSPGKEFEIFLAYRNMCNYSVSNALLTLILPPEVELLSSDYCAGFTRNGNNVSYEIGKISSNSEGRISLRAKVKESTPENSNLAFSANLNFNDNKNKPQKTLAYWNAYVAQPTGLAAEKPLTAAVIETPKILSNWWILVICLIAAIIASAIFSYLFFKKRNSENPEKQVVLGRNLQNLRFDSQR